MRNRFVSLYTHSTPAHTHTHTGTNKLFINIKTETDQLLKFNEIIERMGGIGETGWMRIGTYTVKLNIFQFVETTHFSVD